MEYIEVLGRKFAFIKSKENEKIKAFAKLAEQKYRNRDGLYLAEGVKLSEEALKSDCLKYLLINYDNSLNQEVLRLLEFTKENCEVLMLSEQAFRKVSTEQAPQGIIAVCEIPDEQSFDDFIYEASDIKILAIDGMRDPGNLGTVMRSALAFGLDALLVGDCADIYSPKTVRASMGAVFSLPIIVCDELSEYLLRLKNGGRRIIGAVLRDNSLNLGAYKLDYRDIIVIGNEGHGISKNVLDVCTDYLKIPMMPSSESLNAATAASIIMWEYFKNK